MKNKAEGFTLLEAIIAVMLFAILLQFLLSFFASMYLSAKTFQQKTYLEDQARVVKEFVCEQIRKSEQVSIEYVGGSHPITNVTEAADNFEVIDQPLVNIVLDNGKKMSLKANPAKSKGIGKLQLVYIGGGTTPNLISDEIESIKVTREKDSDYISFTCVFCMKGEKDENLILTRTFCESLAYKKKT